ncbi:MAG: amino acid ABC transporter ATP-binding protein, partial [Paracoccaceae bacterium]
MNQESVPSASAAASTASSAAPVIQIRDLRKSYGPLEVLKGVSMTAPRGHVISLI